MPDLTYPPSKVNVANAGKETSSLSSESESPTPTLIPIAIVDDDDVISAHKSKHVTYSDGDVDVSKYPPLPHGRQSFTFKKPSSSTQSATAGSISSGGEYLKRSKQSSKPLKDTGLLKAVKANYRFIYRINDGVGTTNTILQKVCEDRGWREFREASLFRPGTTPYERVMRGATGWNLWWSYSIYQFSPYKYLRNWQFTNHNPKGFQFCNKLYLTMYMRKMQVIHGTSFNFYPTSFIIPEDYLRLSSEHFRRAGESFTQYNHHNLLAEKPLTCYSEPVPITPNKPAGFSNHNSPYSTSPYHSNFRRPKTGLGFSSRNSYGFHHHRRPITSSSVSTSKFSNFQAALLQDNIRFNPVWISKPVALSQGKGIFLTTDLNTITTDKKAIVQEYITRPLLIGGYKWDVRIYVCVAAVDPLVIYIYNEGLCRFCTEKYNTKDLSRMFSHLTNASLNKMSPSYEDDKDLIGLGCKWTLRKLRKHFKDRKISDWLLWQKIMAMVVLTVIGDSLRLGYSASNRNCFDLFGFDVLVDENLKPWLLECNYSPGLGGDCETDYIVKKPMLNELFDLLGFPDKKWYTEDSISETSISTGNTVSHKSGVDKNNKESHKTHVSQESTSNTYVQYDKEDITRHYFDMLLARIKVNAISEGDHPDLRRRKAGKFTEDVNNQKTEMRLNDAKTIYSQNLVVQYLKNQSTGGHNLSKPVRDQLISVAAEKLRKKLSAMSCGSKKEKKAANAKISSSSSGTTLKQTQDEETKKVSKADDVNNNGDVIIKEVANENGNGKTKEEKEQRPISNPIPDAPTKLKSVAPTSGTANSSSSSQSSSSSIIMTTIKKEFPSADSEAFQKLKYYFDAGVDYPMDAKTGKFKDCPALISVKKDWFNPPKQEGGWIRVYPFDTRTTKSPYKSSLSDIRQAVRSMESYLKFAEHLSLLHPSESDEFYRKKMKTICRKDTEIWVPPGSTPSPTARPSSVVAALVQNNDQKKSNDDGDEERPSTATSNGSSSSINTNSCSDANNNIVRGTRIKIVETDIVDLDNQNNNIIRANNNDSYCWKTSSEMAV